jgi:hypothetical protein
MSFGQSHFDTIAAGVLHCPFDPLLWHRGVLNRKVVMKRLAFLLLAMTVVGCARPGEIGYTPAYSATEHTQQIARNWDIEGKEMMDDIDHALLLNPTSHLTLWNVR